MASSRLLITVSLAFAVVLGAFLTLISGSWAWLPLVLAVHAGGTAAVVIVTMRLLGEDAGDLASPGDDAAAAAYEELRAKGVEFTEEPTERFYGTDCGLRDPFGNPLRIGQPKQGPIEMPEPAEFSASGFATEKP